MDLGRFLGGFGVDLGAILLHFWQGFGKIWDLERIFTRFWKLRGIVSSIFSIGTPALLHSILSVTALGQRIVLQHYVVHTETVFYI